MVCVTGFIQTSSLVLSLSQANKTRLPAIINKVDKKRIIISLAIELPNNQEILNIWLSYVFFRPRADIYFVLPPMYYRCNLTLSLLALSRKAVSPPSKILQTAVRMETFSKPPA